MKVTTKEIVEALRGECNGYQRVVLADRIEAEGIEQPSGGYGRTPIAWAVDTKHHGRCYSVSDEFLKAFPNFPIPPSKADQMTRCVECGGSGVDPIPYPVCCKRPDGDGGCCGSPEPEWGWCSDCDGSGLVSSYVSPPSIKDLVEEIKAVGVNNHMAIQALVDKYSLLK